MTTANETTPLTREEVKRWLAQLDDGVGPDRDDVARVLATVDALAAARAELADANARANGDAQRAAAYQRELTEARNAADGLRVELLALRDVLRDGRACSGACECASCVADYDRVMNDTRSSATMLAEHDATLRAEVADLRSKLEAEQHHADKATGEAATLRAEVARLRKLFDDAGQGEHNVLALVDHYQDAMLKAKARAARLAAERDEARAVVPWDHDPGAPDVPVTQARYDTLRADLDFARAEAQLANAHLADATRQREECAAEAQRLREALESISRDETSEAGDAILKARVDGVLFAPSPAAAVLAEVRAEARREALEAAVRAAREAKLPARYQWGSDAMESFTFGAERAAEAVLALTTASEAPEPAGPSQMVGGLRQLGDLGETLRPLEAPKPASAVCGECGGDRLVWRSDGGGGRVPCPACAPKERP